MTDTQTDPESWAGHRFRELLKERGWSQGELARRMKVHFGYMWSQATVTRVLAATRPTPLNEIADLAALFGFKLSDFLADAPARRLACSTCGEGPPEGFTCNTCGRSGA